MAAMTAVVAPRPSNDDRVRAALWFAGQGFGIFSVWSTDAGGVCRCPAPTTVISWSVWSIK